MKLKIISAMTLDGVIGLDDKMPWYIPEDLQHFKKCTSSGYIIVGYKTFKTLPQKAFLNNRSYLVLTSKESRYYPYYYSSIESLLKFCNKIEQPYCDSIYVAGGQTIYEQLLDMCDSAVITYIDDSTIKGNKYFPIQKFLTIFDEISSTEWLISRTGIKYKMVEYMRKENGNKTETNNKS